MLIMLKEIFRNLHFHCLYESPLLKFLTKMQTKLKTIHNSDAIRKYVKCGKVINSG